MPIGPMVRTGITLPSSVSIIVFMKLIEKITVFANHFTVEFKSGITIEIEA